MPIRTQYFWIGFVVAQDDVVTRPVRLDQVALKQQRFGLRIDDGDLDASNTLEHGRHLGRLRPRTEIAGHARTQMGRLANVDEHTTRVVHPVDTGTTRERTDQRLEIGSFCGHGVRSQAAIMGSAALPTALSNEHGQLERLLVIETRIHMRAVGALQVGIS